MRPDGSPIDFLPTVTQPGKISIVIPCYNHGATLPETLASVDRVRNGRVGEVIIVDDGSTDERTCRLFAELQTASQYTVIRQPNRGLAAARNAAIQQATGGYILPLDADNSLRAGYLTHAAQLLDSRPEVGVVYGDAEYFGAKSGRWRVGEFNRGRLLQWNYIDACALYRRQIWEQNGGYDGTMPVQGLEDWDFWLGALEHGWDFAHVPEIFFDYRVGPESMIARARGTEPETAIFIARKHGLLFREAWQQQVRANETLRAENQNLNRQRDSLKAAARNLGRLLKARLR